MNEFYRLYKNLKKELKIFAIDKINRNLKRLKIVNLNNIKLNLGCGSDKKKGFLNIDISKGADFRLDLRKPLPFDDNCIKYIYSSHFLEHLDYFNNTVFNCLLDYYRILKKGGILRIVIPNFKLAFKSYINKDKEYFNLLNKMKISPIYKRYWTLIDFLNLVIYQFGEHKYCYDFEKLFLILKDIGFKEVIKDDFNAEEDIDLDIRKKYSVYLRAIK